MEINKAEQFRKKFFSSKYYTAKNVAEYAQTFSNQENSELLEQNKKLSEKVDKLIQEHQEELKIIKTSHDRNRRHGMHRIAEKRDAQLVLVKRFIKTLKSLKGIS